MLTDLIALWLTPPMPAAELTALLVFASAMAFTPGPNNLLSAALGANRGWRGALPFVLAVPVGWSLLLLACTLGLGALLQAWPLLGGAVKWGGLAYMLWLAWKLAHSAPAAALEAAPGAQTSALERGSRGAFDVGFAKGVGLQFVNGKAWMNALMITANWVTVVHPPWPRMLWVLPVMAAYGFASNLLYALVGSALRHWLLVGQRLRWFNRCLALVLVATALWMAQL